MLDFNDLLRDYSAKDQENITRLLAQLSQYIPLNQIIIVGGIATRYYLSGAGIDKPPFKLNDIDIALKCPFGRISPSLRKDFLIFHLHRKGALFYLTIANLHSKLKVDIFFDDPPTVETKKIKFENSYLQIRSLENQLVKYVIFMQKIIDGRVIDLNLLENTRKLLKIASLSKAERVWKQSVSDRFNYSFQEGFQKIERLSILHPELLVNKPFQIEKPQRCCECQRLPGFPLSPLKNLYKLLPKNGKI